MLVVVVASASNYFYFISLCYSDNNLALKNLCYVLKCLLGTDNIIFLLSNYHPVEKNPAGNSKKIVLVSLLFCSLSSRLAQSLHFMNFQTTPQFCTPTFFFLDGGTIFDIQISYLVRHYISGQREYMLSQNKIIQNKLCRMVKHFEFYFVSLFPKPIIFYIHQELSLDISRMHKKSAEQNLDWITTQNHCIQITRKARKNC